MSRYNRNDARRNIYIPEIGSYIAVQQYMKQEGIIKEIIEFTEDSNNSFSPILGDNDNIMLHEQSYNTSPAGLEELSSNYIENIAKKIIKSQGAKKILKLDISNCYPGFYIHMIPAILLGVKDTEIEYSKFLKCNTDPTINPIYKKYKKLDELIRRQNLNRTNGLLTGILSSKIIMEGILTRIDLELKAEKVNFSRYVDDYEVYIYDDNEKEIISIFNKILKNYGFTLNAEKTEVIEFPYYVTENLENIFKGHLKENFCNSDLMEIFNTFLSIEEKGIKGGLRYLLKSIESNPIKTADSNLFKAYLLTIIQNNERSLTKACSILINNEPLILMDSKDIELIIQMLIKHMKHGHDLEVLWLLYLLIETGNIEKGDSVVNILKDNQNELAHIMLLRKDLLTDEFLEDIKLRASSWILLYELYVFNKISEYYAI
jgi:hypothetical protein